MKSAALPSVLSRKEKSPVIGGRMGHRFDWIVKRKSLPFARKQNIRYLSSQYPTDHSIVAMANVLQPLTSFIPAACARCLPVSRGSQPLRTQTKSGVSGCICLQYASSTSESANSHIQGVTGGTDQTSGECSLGQTIPI